MIKLYLILMMLILIGVECRILEANHLTQCLTCRFAPRDKARRQAVPKCTQIGAK